MSKTSFHVLSIPYNHRRTLNDRVGTFVMDDYGNAVRVDFSALAHFVHQ